MLWQALVLLVRFLFLVISDTYSKQTLYGSVGFKGSSDSNVPLHAGVSGCGGGHLRCLDGIYSVNR